MCRPLGSVGPPVTARSSQGACRLACELAVSSQGLQRDCRYPILEMELSKKMAEHHLMVLDLPSKMKV